MHRHTPHYSTDQVFGRFVGPNRAAHGGICTVDECACGAIRRTNQNGRHHESTGWIEPPPADPIRARDTAGARIAAAIDRNRARNAASRLA